MSDTTSNTKIVVTLGPASDSLETVKALMHAGAQIFRLNTSHGPWVDLQGPKIPLGRFAEGKVTLHTGAFHHHHRHHSRR
jgi:pyruvate kinase